MTGRSAVVGREITRALAVGSDAPDEMFARLADRLRTALGLAGSAWFGMDPATVLPTWPVHIDRLDPAHCAEYWVREFQRPDVALFRDLVRRSVPVGALRADDPRATECARYTEFLAPAGFGDSLRAVFTSGAMAWGAVDLLRSAAGPMFSAHEAAALAALCRWVGEVLRNHHLLRAATGAQSAFGPGLIVFDRGFGIVMTNDDAAHWLSILPDRGDFRWRCSRWSDRHAQWHRGGPARPDAPGFEPVTDAGWCCTGWSSAVTIAYRYGRAGRMQVVTPQ